MPSILGASASTSGRVSSAESRARWTSHHETPNEEAASAAALPDPLTVATGASRSRRVDRARRGTWAVSSGNVRRGHRCSSQKNLRLLWPAGVHPGADHAAGRAASLCGGIDVDPSLAEGEDLAAGDAVVGQVEDGGGSIGARGSRLDQGS